MRAPPRRVDGPKPAKRHGQKVVAPSQSPIMGHPAGPAMAWPFRMKFAPDPPIEILRGRGGPRRMFAVLNLSLGFSALGCFLSGEPTKEPWEEMPSPSARKTNACPLARLSKRIPVKPPQYRPCKARRMTRGHRNRTRDRRLRQRFCHFSTIWASPGERFFFLFHHPPNFAGDLASRLAMLGGRPPNKKRKTRIDSWRGPPPNSPPSAHSARFPWNWENGWPRFSLQSEPAKTWVARSEKKSLIGEEPITSARKHRKKSGPAPPWLRPENLVPEKPPRFPLEEGCFVHGNVFKTEYSAHGP